MAGETATSSGAFRTEQEKALFVTDFWDKFSPPDAVVENWQEVEAYRYATDTTTLEGGDAFSHTTHIPVLATIGQDLEAIVQQVVLPHNDWFTFEAADDESAAADVKLAIVSYIKNRHSLNGYAKQVKKLGGDLISYGVCFSQSFHVDERKNDRGGYVGPKMARLSPYDMAFDPTTNDFANSPKVIRETVTLGELFRRGEKGTFDKDKVMHLLRNRSTFNNQDSAQDKKEQYVPLGFKDLSEYMASGTVELLWFYGDVFDSVNMELHESQIVVTADGQHVLLEDEIKTASGNPHIFMSGWQQLPDNLWSMGPLANIVGLNYQINHRENAKSEGLDRFINPDLVYQGEVEEMMDEESGKITYQALDGGGVQELRADSQFLNFDMQIDRLQHASRAAARLPSDLTGFRSQGEKTLGEVTALTDGGMRGFIDKAGDFEASSLEKHLAADIELAYDNFGEAFKIPNKDEEGFITMLSISKEDLAVNGLLIPRGARRFARKNQVLGSLTQLSNTPLFQMAQQHISGKGAAKMMGELLEIEGEGLFSDFAQITEAAEAQQISTQLQQTTAIAETQPSVEEEQLEMEGEGIDEEFTEE